MRMRKEKQSGGVTIVVIHPVGVATNRPLCPVAVDLLDMWLFRCHLGVTEDFGGGLI